MSFAQDLSNHLGRFHRQAVCGILIQDHSFSFLAPYSSYGAVSSSRIVVAFALGRIACLELQDIQFKGLSATLMKWGWVTIRAPPKLDVSLLWIDPDPSPVLYQLAVHAGKIWWNPCLHPKRQLCRRCSSDIFSTQTRPFSITFRGQIFCLCVELLTGCCNLWQDAILLPCEVILIDMSCTDAHNF